MRASQQGIPRHSISDRLIHWGNSVLWFLLLLSGVALIDNAAVAPFTQGYSAFVRSIVGGGARLLVIHISLGVLWVASLAIYLLVNWRGGVFFLRAIFSPGKGDLVWLFRKGMQMTLGKAVASRLGINPELPPQGYYNAGQKGIAVMIVLCCMAIAGTGLFMAFATAMSAPWLVVLLPWALLVHHAGVFLVLAGLIIHIYMAAFSLEERPGLRSMVSGTVPEEYARHHHPLWLEQFHFENALTDDGASLVRANEE